MKEAVLHYVWQQKLFFSDGLTTTDGEDVLVIDAGKPNTDAGPDFFNAKISIGGTIWAGNIEIHSRSTDWQRHNHQNDKAYDTVILHVVDTADTAVFRTNGEKISQLELRFPAYIVSNYDELIQSKKWIACEGKTGNIQPVYIQSWKNALLTERLQRKTEDIENLLTEYNQHWEEAFYITLARNFGFGTNSDAFEGLARSLPLQIPGKHKDQLFQIEALLFGQAGLLTGSMPDKYSQQLQQEYHFLQKKYALKPLESSRWKLLRLRPDNFPHLRIAQFAALIHSSSKLFSKITEEPDIRMLGSLFTAHPSVYWKNHYRFGHESPAKDKALGNNSVNILLINTVIPFLFHYGVRKDIPEMKEKAIRLLEQLPPEKNSIITAWGNLGFSSQSAYDSQALLELKKNYCDDKKCLRCRIGHKVLTSVINSSAINTHED